MVDKQVRIDLTATDSASKVVDELADNVDELEKSDPKIEISADGSAAVDEIGKVDDAAKKLDDDPIRLTVEAGMAGVFGDLQKLRDELDQTGDEADTTAHRLNNVDRPSGGGGNLRGQAIADLTGPLGDVSSQASDLAGVFDGIGDIVEGAAAKVGISAAGMSTAIGGIGFAIIAATTLWGLFTGAQEKARKKQQELIDGQEKLNDKISEGNYREAAEQFTKLYSGAVTAAEKLGVPAQELVDFITGVSDAVPTATGALEDLRAKGAEMGPTFVNGRLVMGNEVAGMVKSIQDARGEFATTNDTIAIGKDRVDDYADALADSSGDVDDAADAQTRLKDSVDKTRDAYDRMRGALDMESALNNLEGKISEVMNNANTNVGTTSEEILGIKQDIIDVAESAHLNPIEVKTLLDRIDAGDYAGVKHDIEQMSKNNPAVISARLGSVTVPMQGGGTFGQPTVGGTAVPATQVTVNLPAGARGLDALRELSGSTRRTGLRFGAVNRATR